ncbi:MAG: lipoyl synthase [Nitrososphaeraceae archaeon]
MVVELIKKPSWIRRRLLPSGTRYFELKNSLRALELHTVCEEARCPNVAECWESGTATIIIMGDTCSRRCKFCSVRNGKLTNLDPDEPLRVARAVKKWALKYVVITSVCRDDLVDGGAEHIANTIRAIKSISETDIVVEPLIPDFHGNYEAIETIVRAGPQVISHNIETVRRLSPTIRDVRASYEQSLRVLEIVKEISPKIYTKSSLMLGLGECQEEVIESMNDLRAIGVDILTLGQYLQPGFNYTPVYEYISPQSFEHYKRIAERRGFLYVVAGPFVRSSYRAGEMYLQNMTSGNPVTNGHPIEYSPIRENA